MFDPFEAENFVGNLLQFQGFSLHDNRFETGIMIDVDMRTRHDLLEVMVLEIAQDAFKLALVMIVDVRNNSKRRVFDR